MRGDLFDLSPTLSARQAAAIMLQVPASGEPWLDDMIDQAARRQLQGYAMLACMLHNSLIEHARTVMGDNAGSPWSDADVAAYAGAQVDAMMAGQQALDF